MTIDKDEMAGRGIGEYAMQKRDRSNGIDTERVDDSYKTLFDKENAMSVTQQHPRS